jgi:hypothetical protein
VTGQPRRVVDAAKHRYFGKTVQHFAESKQNGQIGLMRRSAHKLGITTLPHVQHEVCWVLLLRCETTYCNHNSDLWLLKSLTCSSTTFVVPPTSKLIFELVEETYFSCHCGMRVIRVVITGCHITAFFRVPNKAAEKALNGARPGSLRLNSSYYFTAQPT